MSAVNSQVKKSVLRSMTAEHFKFVSIEEDEDGTSWFVLSEEGQELYGVGAVLEECFFADADGGDSQMREDGYQPVIRTEDGEMGYLFI